MDVAHSSRLGVAIIAVALVPSFCLAQAVPDQGGPQPFATSQIQLSASAQQYQVVLLQQNAAFNGTFAFSPNDMTADIATSGMTAGVFAAQLEGQLLIGQFATLNVES